MDRDLEQLLTNQKRVDSQIVLAELALFLEKNPNKKDSELTRDTRTKLALCILHKISESECVAVDIETQEQYVIIGKDDKGKVGCIDFFYAIDITPCDITKLNFFQQRHIRKQALKTLRTLYEPHKNYR